MWYIYIYIFVITDIHYWTYIWLYIWYKTRTTTEAVTPLNILHVQERFGQPFLLSFQASHELVVHREAVPWRNLGAFLRAQLPRHNVLRHLPSGHGSIFGYLIGPSVQRKRFNKQITQRIFFCILWAMFGHNIAWARCEIQFLASNI